MEKVKEEKVITISIEQIKNLKLEMLEKTKTILKDEETKEYVDKIYNLCKIVVTGVVDIDDYHNLILQLESYLKVIISKYPGTVFFSFYKSVCVYGLPSKLRSECRELIEYIRRIRNGLRWVHEHEHKKKLRREKEEKMITLEQAKNLKHGDILHHIEYKNADGSPVRLRVTGKVKTWKSNPNRIVVPLKYGYKSYGYLSNEDCLYAGNNFDLTFKDVVLPE